MLYKIISICIPAIYYWLLDKDLETYEKAMCELLSERNDLKLSLFPKTSGAHNEVGTGLSVDITIKMGGG